ncbi:MAG: hypothetical protein U1F43_11500 [Myxococcota bacterium]
MVSSVTQVELDQRAGVMYTRSRAEAGSDAGEPGAGGRGGMGTKAVLPKLRVPKDARSMPVHEAEARR